MRRAARSNAKRRDAGAAEGARAAVLDAGCGLGHGLKALHQAFPQARVHGIDEAARDAWERGVVLGGVSAGSICWHVGGPTDSFSPVLRPITNGLGLIPYGAGVHYDSEEQRRPLLHSLVRDGVLPTSYATDDRVGIRYEGTEPVEVVTDYDVDPATGPAAYRVERSAS